ncbi:hypothetical protein K445DRAFT_263034 [Daldinia sp. EC12]|nr:hypothetical protein K445DRAFT_263034 [Daldinia sp. EC12]
MSFPLFPKFPSEIQAKIWRAYILKANTNRLLLMDSYSKRLMPTRSLTSPALYISVSSRQVYLDMYPVKLSVYRMLNEPDFEEFRDEDVNEDEASLSEWSICYDRPTAGYIYINLQRDIFVVSSFYRSTFHLGKLNLVENQRITILSDTEPLFPHLCRLIKHFAEVRFFKHEEYLSSIHSLARKNIHLFSKKEFSGCQTCRHIYLYSDRRYHGLSVQDRDQRRSFLDDLMTLSGNEVLKKWDSSSFLYEGAMLRESSQ